METTDVITEPRRLTRPRDGRWLGGVCAGLSRYFDLNPLIYRVAFVALSLAGGTGLLLYAAAWLVIPEEGAEDSILAEALDRRRDHPRRIVGIALVGFVAIVVLSSAHWWPSPGNLWLAAVLVGAAIVWWSQSSRQRPAASATTTAGAGSVPGSNENEPAVPVARKRSLGPLAAAALLVGFGIVAIVDAATGANIDWRFVFAASAVALGGLVAAGIVAGHPVGSVVALGFVVLGMLVVATAIRIPLFAGIGDRTETPATIAAVDESYKLGIGDFTIDLSDVRFPPGTTHVKAQLGIGDLEITVPEDVTVVADAHATGGQVTLFGHEADGGSVDLHRTDIGTAPARVLDLDTRVTFGEIRVVRG